jgi:hypothetical protein
MKTIAHVLSLVLAFAALATAGPLCNTGVSLGLCSTLAAVGTADANWQLAQPFPSLPSGTALTAAQLLGLTFGAAYDNVPDPAWLPNGPKSEWLTPSLTGDNNELGGQYVYQTTFTNPGSTTGIQGQYSSDNELYEVFLNDTLVAGFPTDGPTGFNSWTSFTISSGFQAGTNTLDFVVRNRGVGGSDSSPTVTGFRAELAAVPEPSTMVLGLFGLGGFTIVRRRRG